MLGTLLEGTLYIKQFRASDTTIHVAGVLFARKLTVTMRYQKLSSHVIINIIWHHHLQQQTQWMAQVIDAQAMCTILYQVFLWSSHILLVCSFTTSSGPRYRNYTLSFFDSPTCLWA